MLVRSAVVFSCPFRHASDDARVQRGAREICALIPYLAIILASSQRSYKYEVNCRYISAERSTRSTGVFPAVIKTQGSCRFFLFVLPFTKSKQLSNTHLISQPPQPLHNLTPLLDRLGHNNPPTTPPAPINNDTLMLMIRGAHISVPRHLLRILHTSISHSSLGQLHHKARRMR